MLHPQNPTNPRRSFGGFYVVTAVVLRAFVRMASVVAESWVGIAIGTAVLATLGMTHATTHTHSGAAVIIGGRDNGNVVIGNGKTEVDEVEKAVAIR